MKKLLAIITVLIFTFISVFAYAPTRKDEILLDKVYEKVDSIDNDYKLERIAEKIDAVKDNFKSKERIYYILDSIQAYIEVKLDKEMNDVIDGIFGDDGESDDDSDNDEIDNGSDNDNSGSNINSDWDVDDFEYVYEVGLGKQYSEPNDIPWESLKPSSIVRIHWRSEPYRNKWVINVAASKSNPVVVIWVPSSSGELPIISGNGATTRQALDYRNENRSVIKIWGSSKPSNETPSRIYVENLDIRSGHPNYNFVDDRANPSTYSSNAAAIHMEYGKNITVKGCKLHDSGNGLFTTHFTENIVIAGNQIYDNGIIGNYYSHNTYTESKGIIYEYNYFWAPKGWGNNLKDRSSGTIIRYNWIEDGNRQLDLVETDHQELYDAYNYQKTYVYGNILIESDDTWNSQMIHYGGDSGDETYYRRGTIYLYYNTFVSRRTTNTTLIRLATSDAKADIKNNIIFAVAGKGKLAITTGKWLVNMQNNWITEAWKNTHESYFDGVMTENGNITGTSPWFVGWENEDFRLGSSSVCKDKGIWFWTLMDVKYQYDGVAGFEERSSISDLGALE